MNNTIKVEQWNGFDIRWIAIDGDWLAVGNDIAKALGYAKPQNAIASHVDLEDIKTLIYKACPDSVKANLWQGNDYSDKTVITEFGIYSLIFSSQLPEAKSFKRWVLEVTAELRKSENLKAYEAMQMLSKEHQKNSMSNLKAGLKAVSKVDYIKANTIADKAVSNEFGFDKMVKKADMSPEMLAERDKRLNDVVDLMTIKDRLGIDMSVSKTIYNRKAM